MTRLACNWYCILLLDFTYDYIYHCYYITLVVLASITLHTLSIGKGISDCVGNMTVNTESIYWKHLLSKSKQYFLKLLVIQICFIESPPPPPSRSPSTFPFSLGRSLLIWGCHICIYSTSTRYHVHWMRHSAPASSAWLQLCELSALRGQSMSRLSVPTHRTLSRRMLPTPRPK